jgi:hypothetical protein
LPPGLLKRPPLPPLLPPVAMHMPLELQTSPCAQAPVWVAEHRCAHTPEAQ